MARRSKSALQYLEATDAKDVILERDFAQIIDERFTNYAFAVMGDRALPDARDGMKPSQRRTLVAMNDLSLRAGGKTKKCAKICGDVSGNYHPHGEAVVYPTLVRMAQDWVLRYPLITPQGNFGSPDPDDKAAAMRYTEAKLSAYGDAMVGDLNDQVVPYIPNYNDELREPTVLPSLLPNLLVNGCAGIAVGWATNMAPHNLREVAALIEAHIANPHLTTDEVLAIMPGPDFPMPCRLLGQEGVRSYYETGKGTVQIEGAYEIDAEKNGQQFIKITQLPYGGSPEIFGRQIKELVESKKIEGVSDFKNLSSKRGMLIKVAVHRSANAQVVLNLILKHTCLRTSFSVNTTVLIDGKTVVENVPILQLVDVFVNHRREVLRSKFTAELEGHEKRLHILEGLLGITDKIDGVISLIREADSREQAALELVSKEFVQTSEQAEAVLRITLGTLTKLDTQALQDEFDKKTKRCHWLRDQLASEKKLLRLVAKEQVELAEKYGDARRTEVTQAADHISTEDLIPEEQVLISLTKDGYIKRLPVSTFRVQNRGGKGVIGVKGREADEAADIFGGSSHDLFLFFTNKGLMYKKKGYAIPLAARTGKGMHLANLLELGAGEEVTSTLNLKSLDVDGYFLIATKHGLIKRTEIREYNTVLKQRGLTAIKLNEGDEVAFVQMTNGQRDVALVTANGMAVRYSESAVRDTGRISMGVRAMNLADTDEIRAMITLDAEEDPQILVATELGYAKRTRASEYRCTTGRYTKGVRTIDTVKRDRNGLIVTALATTEEDTILALTAKGKIIRLHVKDIPSKGRNTMGNEMVKLDKGDKLMAVVKAPQDDESYEESIEATL